MRLLWRMKEWAYFAKISIVEVLLKLFLTIVITNIAFDKLKMSVLMMFNAAVIFTIYFVYCRTHFDYTKYIFCFDKPCSSVSCPLLDGTC